ncbi:recombinase family protein [Oscillospiraceae bacterium PP1C4]
MKTAFRVGCYVRVSTENQIENYSIDEQIERLKAYCKAKDWAIYKFYTDAGYSGGSVDRPALIQMISDIKSKSIELVVVYKLDRLSRSQKDTLTLIENEFLSRGVDFVSMSENFDTSTPFGRAMIGILSVFAQLEKDQITERFTMGRIGRSKAGYYHGGSTAPTGYNYIDGKLEVDEYIAEQVREVYDRFLNGYSINSIHKYMNDKYGEWNSHALVINVLRNSVYIGKVKFKKREYDGLHQPIISKESFYRAQQLLKSSERESNKTTAQKTPFRAGYMLSSLVYCKKCGARYSANHGYYRCYSRAKSSKRFIIDPNCKNDNWDIEELDELIIHELRRLKHSNDYFESIFESSEGNPQIDKKSALDSIKKIDSQISRMIDLYQVGGISIEQISNKISLLQKEKSNLESKIVQPNSYIQETRDRFIQSIEKMDEVFESGSVEEKRMLVSSFVDKIWVDGENVSIEWRI